jgi:hypothetical protein
MEATCALTGAIPNHVASTTRPRPVSPFTQEASGDHRQEGTASSNSSWPGRSRPACGYGMLRKKSWRTVWPGGINTASVSFGWTSLTVAPRKVPVIVYEPAGSGISTNWPLVELLVATTSPLALVTSTVPGPGDGGGSLQPGDENRRASGPPTRKNPLTSSVVPSLTNGSFNSGGYAASRRQKGLSQTVTLAEGRPRAGDWRSTVWITASSSAEPFRRSLQRACAARSRATLSVRPVSPGTRQPLPTAVSRCADALPDTEQSDIAAATSTQRIVTAPLSSARFIAPNVTSPPQRPTAVTASATQPIVKPTSTTVLIAR